MGPALKIRMLGARKSLNLEPDQETLLCTAPTTTMMVWLPPWPSHPFRPLHLMVAQRHSQNVCIGRMHHGISAAPSNDEHSSSRILSLPIQLTW